MIEQSERKVIPDWAMLISVICYIKSKIVGSLGNYNDEGVCVLDRLEQIRVRHNMWCNLDSRHYEGHVRGSEYF